MLAGKVQIADNGGADLLYWTGPAAERKAAIARMRAIAKRVARRAGHATTARTRGCASGPEAGDVVVFCQAGWRFSDPDPVTSNPIPGNHGHPATRQDPVLHRRRPPLRPEAASRRRGTPAPSTSRRPWPAFFGLRSASPTGRVRRLRPARLTRDRPSFHRRRSA